MLPPRPARRLACGAGVVLAATVALTGCVGAAATDASRPTVTAPQPSASARPVSEPSPTPSPDPTVEQSGTVVMIGDSIMSGYGIDADDAWPEVLQRETGVPIVNLGCDGAGFVEEGSCGTDYAGMIAEAAADDPVLVVIQSSDNDSDDSVAAIRTATQQTVERLHAAIPHARIVGLSTLWNLPWDAPDTIQASSDALQAAVTSVGGTFLSVGQPFQDDPDLLQADSEHPTEEGQRVLAAVVRMAFIDGGVRM